MWVEYGDELAGALCVGCAEDRNNSHYVDRRRRTTYGVTVGSCECFASDDVLGSGVRKEIHALLFLAVFVPPFPPFIL